MAVFFEPININDWNMFEKVKHVGHIEPVLAVNTMNLGDVVLLYVGKQNADIKSGVYAYGIIVKTPYIYKANPADQCYGKNAVDIRIDRIVYRTPLIDADDFKKYVNQYRTPHMMRSPRPVLQAVPWQDIFTDMWLRKILMSLSRGIRWARRQGLS